MSFRLFTRSEVHLTSTSGYGAKWSL